MIEYFRKSLARKVILINFIFVFLLVAGAVSLRIYHVQLTNSLDKEISYQTTKLNNVTKLKEDLNEVLFDGRGYFAFKQDDFLKRIDVNKANIKSSVALFEKTYKEPKDKTLIREVQNFNEDYLNTLLPKAIEYRKNDQVADIIKMSQQDGGTEKVNLILNRLDLFEANVQEDIEKAYEKKEEKIDKSQIIYFSFISLMVTVFIFLIRLMIRNFGSPLRELSHVASRITRGEFVDSVPFTNRLDEIGVLSVSFEKMIRSIRQNEQELTAQNEELAAQQDELSSQQERLRYSLKKTEENERKLLRLNSFLHSISNIIEQSELLKSMISNMTELTHSNKGLIWLPEKNQLSSTGLSELEIDHFRRSFKNSGLLARIQECMASQQVIRKSNSDEQGYVTEEYTCGDLYIPVYTGQQKLIAVVVLTRIGSSYSNNEIAEYENLSRQIALSIEKQNLYTRSEEQRITMQNVLDSIQEGVQLVDSDGTIVQVNQKFCELMDCSLPHQLNGLTLGAWTNTLKKAVEDGQDLADFINNAVHGKNNEGSSFIFEVNSKDTKIIQIYSEYLASNEEQRGTVLVYRDITKQYEVDRMKSEFVTTVSHELRTPLSSVLGFTELMLTRELKPERQKKYLTTIHQEAYRLTALINDFLDVQKMESGRLTYDKKYHTIVPIIEDVIDIQRVNAARHTFSINLKTDRLTIYGDRDKLSQIFMNLISNAVKYSPEGGNIIVNIYDDEKHLFVDIEDEGLGIPNEAISSLFEKFYRVDNSDRRKIGGTGLGLAIVMEIVKSHNGSISVQSLLGKGSTFTVAFPTVEDIYVNASLSETKKRKIDIVIVEDDRHLAALLSEELVSHGFHIAHFNTGEQAAEAVKECLPQAVILDIMLDGKMNGWDVLKKLKLQIETSDIPIIISSALDEKEKGIDLGAAGYLVKPYQLSQLTANILKIINEHNMDGRVLIPIYDGQK
ncbi:ATP-binding protein [Fictibacillus aquaticus]|uniref:histidine kinase n=1 Tax=Fictibacillus aquaticus TaxID=2021314 RepID=A0A235FB98_9BACL|nr:ATP-binding protein [Fictibacillus aquaticus]OYD58616.1 hypothetical protein CGZ90_01565 [Fictibacillus aquaticus]